MEAQRAKRSMRPEDIPHGTASGYRFWGCRCEPCVVAQKSKVQALAKRRNDATREVAHHHNHLWTGAELEVAARADLTAKQVAVMLGRTVSAVHTKRRLMENDPKTIRFAGVQR